MRFYVLFSQEKIMSIHIIFYASWKNIDNYFCLIDYTFNIIPSCFACVTLTNISFKQLSLQIFSSFPKQKHTSYTATRMRLSTSHSKRKCHFPHLSNELHFDTFGCWDEFEKNSWLVNQPPLTSHVPPPPPEIAGVPYDQGLLPIGFP